MSKIQNKLKEYGLELPQLSEPGGNYKSVNIRGKIAYIAIQFPIFDGEFLYQGQLGNSLNLEDGIKAMELCGLNVLAQINKKIGFENIEGLNHIEAIYQSTEDWDDAPKMVNGASDLFVNILEEKGSHSRSIFGVKSLPRNFSVGLTVHLTLK